MARELVIDVEMNSVEAETALIRFETALIKAGFSAEEAAEKVKKFEQSYQTSAARKRAKDELDALSGAAAKTGDAAEKSTKQVSAKDKALSSLTSTVLKFAAPAVIGAAIKNTLDWAGSLSDLSKTTGISTTSLQKFEIIGKSSGATMTDIANAAVSLSDKLAGGNKSAAEAIGRVGLSLGQLTSMSPDKALLEVAHAAAQIANPMERVAFLTDAVGAAGAKKLLPMLDDLEAKWNTVGGVIDEKGIQALDDVGEAFGEVGTIGKQFLAEVLIPLAPGFTELTRSVLDFVSDTIPKLQAWFSGVLDGFMRVELAFREFDDNMRNAGLRELDRVDPARAGAFRQANGLPAGGFFNNAQTARDRLAAFQFAGSAASGGNLGQGMFGPAFFQPPAAPPGKPPKGAKVLPFVSPYTANQWANISAVLGPANPLGNGGLGSFPGFAFGDPLTNLMSASRMGIGFDRNSSMVPFAGTVPMNAPGGGGGLGGFLSGHKTQLAGLGLGLLSRFIPQGGRVGGALSGAAQGASMGAMFGPWGMGIGAALGGIGGLFTGGKAAKNARNAETSQVFEQFSTKEFIAMQKEADRLGISLEKALKAKTMKDFGAAVDEVRGKLEEMTALEDQIKALTDAVTVDFDKMNAVVQEFGLDVSKLGPAFQQLKIDKEAQRIIDAMAIMEKGGADMTGVLEGMADEISKVVQDSIKFGTTIPENMKPWIEELIKSGKLVDENGQAITDMSKIKFGAAMESDMSKLTKKLDELIAQLAKLAGGFDRAAGAARELADVPQPDWQTQPASGEREPAGFATGGLAGRDFRRPGHGDIFPALLKRGETVLPAGVGRGGVSLSIGNLSVGGGYGSRTEAVEEIGDAVVQYLERRGARLVA